MSEPSAKPKGRRQLSFEEPKKKAKLTEMLRAHEDRDGSEMFFEIDDLEQAKLWLLEQWEFYEYDVETVAYYIEKCTTEKVEKIFRLDKTECLVYKNKSTLKELQEAAPALTDEAIEQLVNHLSHSEATLTLDFNLFE